MSFSRKESGPSLLGDYLVEKDDGTLELVLDMKPFGTFSEFVSAIRSCRDQVSSVHVHKMFMRDLTESQQTEIFDSLQDLKEIHISFVTLPVRLLADLLLRCNELERLCLDCIVLVTDPPPTGSSSAGSTTTNNTDGEDAIFFSALQGLQSLEDFYFSLSATNVAPEGKKLFVQVDDEFDTLFQSLCGIGRSLRKVYISIGRNFADHCDIQEGTLRSLLCNTSVQELSLVHFPLHKEHCQAIAEAGSNLTSLCLVNAEIGDESTDILARGLAGMTKLQRLCLPGNKIGDIGASSITQVLSSPQLEEESSVLKVLDLHANQLTSALGHELATMLKTNQELSFLDLSSNKLEDDGVQAMVEALCSNNTLAELNLFCTGLTNRSCLSFAEVLRANKSLTKLNLYHNEDIDSKGIRVLVKTMKHSNYDLKRLEISKKQRTMMGGGDFGLDFYLRLNREYTRRSMETQATEVEYVDAISQAVTKGDLASIYYFLQARPSLCNDCQN